MPRTIGDQPFGAGEGDLRFGMPLAADRRVDLGAVLDRAGCDLLLDVNNIYVNSINHRYDPLQFLDSLPGERVRYIHIAGHYEEAEDLRVDTHGADVIAPVWQLLDRAYRNFGVIPTLLERDFNIPPVAELMGEIAQINRLQQQYRALPLAANG